MSILLEIREKIYSIIRKRQRVLLVIVKFLVAFCAIAFLSDKLGNGHFWDNYFVCAGLSAICAMAIPLVTVIICALIFLADLFVLDVQLFIVAVLVIIFMLCLFMRFTRKSAYYVVLTPLFHFAGIACVAPTTVGLLRKPYDVISVVFGTVCYFIIKNVGINAADFLDLGNDISNEENFHTIMNLLLSDYEMYLYIIAFVAAAIVVYCIRSTSMDHAWGISVLIGSALQMVILCCGQIAFGNVSAILPLIIGCVISYFISLIVMFFVRTLDYSRVENTMFEDDDYYYYVKAIPKAAMTIQDKQVKKISTKKKKHGSSSAQDDMSGKQNGNGTGPDADDQALKGFDVDGDWIE